MLLHQFGDDLVPVFHLILKMTDLLFVGVLLPFRIGLIRPACEGAGGVLEELFLPVVVLRGVPMFIEKGRTRRTGRIPARSRASVGEPSPPSARE